MMVAAVPCKTNVAERNPSGARSGAEKLTNGSKLQRKLVFCMFEIALNTILESLFILRIVFCCTPPCTWICTLGTGADVTNTGISKLDGDRRGFITVTVKTYGTVKSSNVSGGMTSSGVSGRANGVPLSFLQVLMRFPS
eukprot:2273916-Rhodomonas_salina.1